MRTAKILMKTSIFPAAKKTVFAKLKELNTLQYIAKPYAAFLPEHGQGNFVWEENAVFSFRFKLFGFIPLGTHTINVISFSESDGIYTHEYNPHVPTWNHRIILDQIDQDKTRYTDEVKIDAGWKTPFVYLWAKAFYAHRQRKWIKLLNSHE